MSRRHIQITQSDIKRMARQQLPKIAQQAHRAVRPYPGVNTSEIHRAIDKAIEQARRKLS